MKDLIDFNEFTDLKQLQAQAKKLGTTELILAKNYSKPELKKLKNELGQNNFNFKTCQVLEKTDAREVKVFRQLADYVAVKGGNMKLNKFAVNQKEVDFLLQPLGSGKMEMDTAIVRLAAQRKVRIVFLFTDFLNSHGYAKSLMLKNALMLVKLMKNLKVEARFWSGAKNAFELRAPKDLSSLLVLLGFTEKQALKFAGS